MMKTDQTSTRGLGGWSVFADFAGVFLRASIAGLLTSLAASAIVLAIG
jgi:hypothetical protein